MENVTPATTVSDVVARLRRAGCVDAEEEAGLLVAEARGPEHLTGMVARRVAGEPLEHVLGWALFCGLRIAVGPGVFVPRRRTEVLAEEAVRLTGPDAVVVDLCCGSGAVGAVLAARVPGAEVHAADIDPAALRSARRNLPACGRVHTGDLFDALPGGLRGRVDVLVANVPYVPTAAIPLLPAEARDHEPRAALDGGADGLDVLRRVSRGAPDWLAPGGHVLMEVGEDQVPAALDVLSRAGLDPRMIEDEDRGGIVVVGTAVSWTFDTRRDVDR